MIRGMIFKKRHFPGENEVHAAGNDGEIDAPGGDQFAVQIHGQGLGRLHVQLPAAVVDQVFFRYGAVRYDIGAVQLFPMFLSRCHPHRAEGQAVQFLRMSVSVCAHGGGIL